MMPGCQPPCVQSTVSAMATKVDTRRQAGGVRSEHGADVRLSQHGMCGRTTVGGDVTFRGPISFYF